MFTFINISLGKWRKPERGKAFIVTGVAFSPYSGAGVKRRRQTIFQKRVFPVQRGLFGIIGQGLFIASGIMRKRGDVTCIGGEHFKLVVRGPNGAQQHFGNGKPFPFFDLVQVPLTALDITMFAGMTPGKSFLLQPVALGERQKRDSMDVR